MKYQKFSEYLDANKKLKTSGTVKKIADFEGKVDAKPEKEKKHKDAGGKGQTGEAKPYKGGTDAKDPNKGKLKDGFADKGDKKLKYEPEDKISKSEEGVPGGKKASSWPKTKMQDWIDRTKDLSLAEFAKTVRKESLKGLDECACQEAPHNAIKETVEVCKHNKRYLAALVREMKRNKLFGDLFNEMIQHPDAYAALALLMEKDESVSRKLVKAMSEDVGPPMGDESGMGMMPKKKKPSMNLGDEGDSDMGDEENDIDADSDMDDMDGEEDLGSEDDMGDETGEMDGGMGDEMPMPKPKKKKAADHLLGAMKAHPGMNNSIAGAFGGGM